MFSTIRTRALTPFIPPPCRFARELAAGSASASGGCTDAANRLGHLIKALTKAPASAVEPLSKEWVPLVLEFCASRHGGAAGWKVSG